MIEWIKGSVFTSIVTLYPNNFTLNNCAAVNFMDVRYCQIGIDRSNLKVAIRPVTKRELDLNLVPLEQLHKVSVGKGYVRICNKPILQEIASLIQCDVNGLKFPSSFDEGQHVLIIDLKSPM